VSAPIAAVTGASRGIGRATALELARRGHRTFALARSEADLEELAREAKDQSLDVVPLVMDVAEEATRRRAVDAIMEATEGYGVDVLVNNAGYGQLGPLEEVTPEQLRRQLEVNVVGLHAFTRPFLPGMRERGQGRIVNVSSAAGRVSTPFMGAYCASKFALEAMSDALRVELRPFGVRVVLIEPGPIRTSFGEVAGRLSASRPTSPYARYEGGYRQARQGSDLFGRSPQAVARAIARAVEAEHARARYTVTLPAKLAAMARRLVPDAVVDWALLVAMRLRAD
jgi:short-subunit dehydrogenase